MGTKTKIMGLTFTDGQSLLRAGVVKTGDKLILTREPENPIDKNAIAVYTGEHKLGYLSREIAKELAPWMDQTDNSYHAEVLDVTGGKDGKENYGCNIEIHEVKASLIVNSDNYEPEYHATEDTFSDVDYDHGWDGNAVTKDGGPE